MSTSDTATNAPGSPGAPGLPGVTGTTGTDGTSGAPGAPGGVSVNGSPSVPGLFYDDTVTGVTGSDPGQVYAGPVNTLQWQYLWTGSDGVDISTILPNVFLRGGLGNDALEVHAGSNVLDGGTGSNFLVGASGADGGTDTFFLDGRQSTPTWDTVVNFHHGDAVTLWGFVPGQSTMNWVATDGAAGYQGATIHSALAGAGKPVNASITFAGESLADAQSKFTASTGTVGGIRYLNVRYTG